MDLRKVFCEYKSGNYKPKTKTPETPKKEVTPSKSTYVECPHCNGSGLEPKAENYTCCICLGKGKLKNRAKDRYEKKKLEMEGGEK